jgi:hypothetical protein
VPPDGLQNAILSTAEINGNKTSNEKKNYMMASLQPWWV